MTNFILLFTCLITQSLASDIQFMSHNIKGRTYIDETGELRGKKHAGRRAFNIELVREMMILLSHRREFKEIPFARGLMTIQKEQNYALFNVTRTPDRENTVKWVGPLQIDEAFFYELKDAPTKIKTLEDAKNVGTICVLNKGVHDAFLQGQGFTNLHRVDNYTNCFKMLAAKRVFLTPSDTSVLKERLIESGISNQLIQQTPVFLFETKGYIAFSKNIPDGIIQQWQDALNQLKQSGKYDQLIREYYADE